MLNLTLMLIPLFIAICILALCLGISLRVVFRSLFRCLRKYRQKNSECSDETALFSTSTSEKISLSICVASLIAFAYSWWVEPYWPQVEHIRIASSKLAPGEDPIRIAFISDTHSETTLRVETKIPRILEELLPQAIFFGGDALNSEAALPAFQKMFSKLSAIAPTYAVRGNWDIWFYANTNLYGGTSVNVLNNTQVELPLKDLSLSVAGFAVLPGRASKNKKEYESKVSTLLSAMPPDHFRIFLHHYPEVGEIAVQQGADLALGGDTHGGQVRVPLIGPLVRLSRIGRFFSNRLHQIASGHLYVNRGLGLEGGTAPRVRFLCRPEITLIEIIPEG